MASAAPTSSPKRTWDDVVKERRQRFKRPFKARFTVPYDPEDMQDQEEDEDVKVMDKSRVTTKKIAWIFFDTQLAAVAEDAGRRCQMGGKFTDIISVPILANDIRDAAAIRRTMERYTQRPENMRAGNIVFIMCFHGAPMRIFAREVLEGMPNAPRPGVREYEKKRDKWDKHFDMLEEEAIERIRPAMTLGIREADGSTSNFYIPVSTFLVDLSQVLEGNRRAKVFFSSCLIGNGFVKESVSFPRFEEKIKLMRPGIEFAVSAYKKELMYHEHYDIRGTHLQWIELGLPGHGPDFERCLRDGMVLIMCSSSGVTNTFTKDEVDWEAREEQRTGEEGDISETGGKIKKQKSLLDLLLRKK